MEDRYLFKAKRLDNGEWFRETLFFQKMCMKHIKLL